MAACGTHEAGSGAFLPPRKRFLAVFRHDSIYQSPCNRSMEDEQEKAANCARSMVKEEEKAGNCAGLVDEEEEPGNDAFSNGEGLMEKDKELKEPQQEGKSVIIEDIHGDCKLTSTNSVTRQYIRKKTIERSKEAKDTNNIAISPQHQLLESAESQASVGSMGADNLVLGQHELAKVEESHVPLPSVAAQDLVKVQCTAGEHSLLMPQASMHVHSNLVSQDEDLRPRRNPSRQPAKQRKQKEYIGIEPSPNLDTLNDEELARQLHRAINSSRRIYCYHGQM